MKSNCIINTTSLNTPLGSMVLIADEKGLYMLGFSDHPDLKSDIESLKKKLKATILQQETPLLKNIRNELMQYFAGNNFTFNTPVHFTGTPFQNRVWEELRKIPAGKTQSYLEVAKALNKPTAYRAVAQANSANPLPIIVPCHRVINANGELGGYNGGIDRKKWFLAHENKFYCG